MTGSGSSDYTIAIVDAYGYPNAESDLAVYRATYGLPACTTANGCFKKVNQNGVQSSYPRTTRVGIRSRRSTSTWPSAMCPNCKILLVQATAASFQT